MSLVSIPFTFTVGAVIIASQHNSNFSIIYNDYNGNITDVNIASNAAIEYSKLSLSNSIKGTDILSNTTFAVGNIPTLSYSNITEFPYVKVSEVQTQGTSAGNSVSGSWITRVLNTTDNDTASISSLATNQLTLPAGTYKISASSPFYNVANAQIRLQNITSSTTLLNGTTEHPGATVNAQCRSFINGRFVLSGTSALAIQYQVSTNGVSNGLGQAANFGTEVYTIAEFQKVA